VWPGRAGSARTHPGRVRGARVGYLQPMFENDPGSLADELESEADDMQHRSEVLEKDTNDVAQEWASKRSDPTVPGATPDDDDEDDKDDEEESWDDPDDDDEDSDDDDEEDDDDDWE
jgi:ribonuclease E